MSMCVCKAVRLPLWEVEMRWETGKQGVGAQWWGVRRVCLILFQVWDLPKCYIYNIKSFYKKKSLSFWTTSLDQRSEKWGEYGERFFLFNWTLIYYGKDKVLPWTRLCQIINSQKSDWKGSLPFMERSVEKWLAGVRFESLYPKRLAPSPNALDRLGNLPLCKWEKKQITAISTAQKTYKESKFSVNFVYITFSTPFQQTLVGNFTSFKQAKSELKLYAQTIPRFPRTKYQVLHPPWFSAL